MKGQHLLRGLAALFSSFRDVLKSTGETVMSVGNVRRFEGTRASKRGSTKGAAEKKLWNEANPGVPKCLRQYERRYRNAGASKARFPFSER